MSMIHIYYIVDEKMKKPSDVNGGSNPYESVPNRNHNCPLASRLIIINNNINKLSHQMLHFPTFPPSFCTELYILETTYTL